jgi:hypothetical protein
MLSLLYVIIDVAVPFGFIAPCNWNKVKKNQGQRPYLAIEVTGSVSWVQPPPASFFILLGVVIMEPGIPPPLKW